MCAYMHTFFNCSLLKRHLKLITICRVVKNIDFSILIEISETLSQDTQYQLFLTQSFHLVWNWMNIMVLQGLNFSMGLHVLCIVLLIPSDFVLMPKVAHIKPNIYKSV